MIDTKRTREFADRLELDDEGDGWAAAQLLKRQADEVDRLRKENKKLMSCWRELKDCGDAHAEVMAEECSADEKHCTCVPTLRGEVERLQAENKKLREDNKRVWDRLRDYGIVV